MENLKLSIVIPCLNEAGTLGTCIDTAVRSVEEGNPSLSYEVIVADNGSRDASISVGKSHGARIVSIPDRGYGAALSGGIQAALGEYVVFADGDGTYPIEDTYRLYQATVEQGADMGIGSRLMGTIEQGAMPALHRYLGTPVLTWLINWLFGGHLSDCNSGFRCVRKAAFLHWHVNSTGMEFASELLIKALKSKAKIIEIPSGLRKGTRAPHLRTWNDGMRHLLCILSERPRLFEKAGLALTAVSTSLQMAAAWVGPIEILQLNVFDLHSKLLFLLGALTGTQLYLFSCMLFLQKAELPGKFTSGLMNLRESSLLLILLVVGVVEAGGVAAIVGHWIYQQFQNLDWADPLLLMVHLLSVPSIWAIGLLGFHIFRKGQ